MGDARQSHQPLNNLLQKAMTGPHEKQEHNQIEHGWIGQWARLNNKPTEHAL
jgi:hypothetical protein